jgi:hypothetical protein
LLLTHTSHTHTETRTLLGGTLPFIVVVVVAVVVVVVAAAVVVVVVVVVIVVVVVFSVHSRTPWPNEAPSSSLY